MGWDQKPPVTVVTGPLQHLQVLTRDYLLEMPSERPRASPPCLNWSFWRIGAWAWANEARPNQTLKTGHASHSLAAAAQANPAPNKRMHETGRPAGEINGHPTTADRVKTGQRDPRPASRKCTNQWRKNRKRRENHININQRSSLRGRPYYRSIAL